MEQSFADGEYADLADQLRANVSRFAAYKANYIKEKYKETADDPTLTPEQRQKALRMAEEKFARWTDAEYNTAVARARTAKQFSEFSDPDRAEVFPNLRWLPSRSVTPRLLHQRFSGKVWAKNDPFWNNNAPGTEWNCKCDIEETDDPCTDNSALGNPEPPRGLEGNPAQTGEVFTDKASYIQKAKSDTEKIALKLTRAAAQQWAFNNLKTVHNDNAGFDIQFSHRGIKEYLNQPHDDYYVKNEMIYRMDDILQSAEYLKETIFKGRKNHIFKTTIKGNENYLIIVERAEGYLFHSITDSKKVIK